MPEPTVAELINGALEKQAAMFKGLLEQQASLLKTQQPPKPPEPELPKIDDPNVAQYVNAVVAESQAKLQSAFEEKLAAWKPAADTTPPQPDTATLMQMLVPDAAVADEAFDKTPYTEGSPFTWGDLKERALQDKSVDIFKQYAKAASAYKAAKAGDVEPPATPSRQNTPPPEPAPVNRDAGLSLLLNGKITQEQFTKDYGGAA